MKAGAGALEERQRLPLHRRDRHQGQRAPRRHDGRDDRPAHLDHDVRSQRAVEQRAAAACRTAWPSWPPWAPPPRSSACSAPSGASTTR
ncbi:MAG: hypothetical protein MZW92_42275 [Comamonadaceae bacterium]|nr:hypothetical protein [Comamonadaceae bacterium]